MKTIKINKKKKKKKNKNVSTHYTNTIEMGKALL